MGKKSGNGNRSGKRVVRDLPLSDAATRGLKRGFNVLASEVLNGLGKALQTAARKL